MLDEVVVNDITFLVDKNATHNYKTQYNEPCSCLYCQNYLRAIQNCSPVLQLLGEFHIIEDFTVLHGEQRKKYGTSILKHLITLAYERKAQTIYLLTDEEDTVKDMYRKLGFIKTDEITELMFLL
ncbi:MAG: hypothetical protein ACFWTN_03750 [Clostridium sp.]